MEAEIAQNIILVGFMGAGKTSLASALAKKTGCNWIDMDVAIEKEAGLSITEIFASKGEEFFRDSESGLLQSLRSRQGLIISTGGGLVVREENRRLLKEIGFVVWMHAPEETLFERVARNSKRPLLQTADPRSTLRELLAARLPWYREVADLEIDTGATPRRQMAGIVLEAAGWQPQSP